MPEVLDIPASVESAATCPECGGETFDFAGERLCEDCIRFQLVRYGDEEC
jgi:hypothetical protein